MTLWSAMSSGHLARNLRQVDFLVLGAELVEDGGDLVVGVVGTEVRAAGGPAGSHLAGLVHVHMPRGECRTQRAARVAGRRLDPDVVELRLAQDLAVAHAVERHATGQHQVLLASGLVDVVGHAQHDRLARHLHRPRQVHLALRQLRLGLPRRTAEEVVEALVGHAQTCHIVEVAHVEAERAVVLEVDEVLENRVDVLRLAVGRQAHHLVLAGVHLEAGVVGEGRIEQADRVREVDLVRDLQIVAIADAEAGGGPLADAVDGQEGRRLVGRREERRRGVRLVVLGEEHLALETGQRPLDERRDEELLLDPQRDRLEERRQAGRCARQVGLQNALEFEEGLVVEGHQVEVGLADAAPLQAEANRFVRELGVLLDAREPLLRRRGHDLAVTSRQAAASW